MFKIYFSTFVVHDHFKTATRYCDSYVTKNRVKKMYYLRGLMTMYKEF